MKGLVLAALLSYLGGACGLGGLTIEQADPNAVPDKVNYTVHIKPRMEYYCVGCHTPRGPLGTAGGWDYSSFQLVRASYQSIFYHSFQAKDMPPGGSRRMTPYDELVFKKWQSLNFPECESDAHCNRGQKCVGNVCKAK